MKMLMLETLAKAKLNTENIKDSNLVAVRHTTFQVSKLLCPEVVHEGVSKSFRTGCLEVQLYCYFVSQFSEFCRHNPLCCFSTNVYCSCLFRYRLSPGTFRYTIIYKH
jgi:hypothetical protein